MKHHVNAKTEQSIVESQLSGTQVHVYSSNKSQTLYCTALPSRYIEKSARILTRFLIVMVILHSFLKCYGNCTFSGQKAQAKNVISEEKNARILFTIMPFDQDANKKVECIFSVSFTKVGKHCVSFKTEKLFFESSQSLLMPLWVHY